MRKFPDSLRLVSRHWRLAKKRTGLRVTTKPAASRLPKQGIAAGNEVQRVTGGSHGQVETRLQYHTGLVNPACFPQRPSMQRLITNARIVTTSDSFIGTITIDRGLIERYDSGRTSVPGVED